METKISRSAAKHQSAKRRRLERQNHRCCYCGIGVVDDTAAHNYATLERIENRPDGTSHGENTVISCALCRSLRAQKNISAMAYYEWVILNQNILNDIREWWGTEVPH